MTPITPIMIIILMLAHQCLRFSFPACCSNWEAPCCSASARWSSSPSFWSRSSTFSTFTRIMPTTSSTLACVCCRRFWAAVCCAELFGGGGKIGILNLLIHMQIHLIIKYNKKYYNNYGCLFKLILSPNSLKNCKHSNAFNILRNIFVLKSCQHQQRSLL